VGIAKFERKAAGAMAVWEVAELTVTPGMEEEFESTFGSVIPILKDAEGSLGLKLLRAVDKEGVFLLFIEWQSVEHHTEIFRKSGGYVKFSSALAPFFTAKPTVTHAREVINGI
jgi:heme-degrading monooxygenase HmoA